ncbi:MAG TPA: ABC transporter, partial [Chitinophagaceae bacterium]|nr:ABC transporter [Chitinophagaceae bacterium]
LVLDEPTNDLDLQTLRTLEEFLLDYPGCILIVSHDRYFMDRLVDHLFVFEGNAVVRDYPGNYSQYREEAAKQESQSAAKAKPTAAPESAQAETPAKKKLSFKEKFELENLEKDLPRLEKEKAELEQKMNANPPFEELQKLAARMSVLLQDLDAKETRWLELSERVS